jgi:transcriptional regulator with XRE-family HTH domain
MYFANNLRLLRLRKKLSQEELATQLNITRSSLSAYENNTAEPSLGTLIAIADHFKLSLDKFIRTDLTKLPEMVLQELEKGYDIDLSGNKLRILACTVDKLQNENIELVPEKARAGYATGYSDPDFIKVLPTFNLPFLSKEKKYRTFCISGDSMPPVKHGSYVTGEYVQNWQSIKSGYPYIVVSKDEGIVFKIINNRIKENKTLQLISTNKLYEPYEIDIRNVLEVWKFVNYISNDFSEPEKTNLEEAIYHIQQEVKQIKNTLRNKS